jgi:hypothetical protein
MLRDGFVEESRSGGLGRSFALGGVVLHILDGSALRGDVSAQVGEGAFGRVVRGVVVVVRGVAALAKPLQYAEGYALETATGSTSTLARRRGSTRPRTTRARRAICSELGRRAASFTRSTRPMASSFGRHPGPSSSRPQWGILVSPSYGLWKGDGFFGTTMGPITVANGVMDAGSMDREGHMYGIDTETGEILWSLATRRWMRGTSARPSRRRRSRCAAASSSDLATSASGSSRAS